MLNQNLKLFVTAAMLSCGLLTPICAMADGDYIIPDGQTVVLTQSLNVTGELSINGILDAAGYDVSAFSMNIGSSGSLINMGNLTINDPNFGLGGGIVGGGFGLGDGGISISSNIDTLSLSTPLELGAVQAMNSLPADQTTLPISAAQNPMTGVTLEIPSASFNGTSVAINQQGFESAGAISNVNGTIELI